MKGSIVVLMVALLLAGCAQQRIVQEAKPAQVDVASDTVTVQTPDATASTDSETDVQAAPSAAPAVTQQDLDRLKSQIQTLNAEDVGGLS